MKRFVRSVLLAGAAGLALGGGIAVAQMFPNNVVTFQVPIVQTVQTSDVFQDIVAGIPTVGNQYATAAAIAGVPGYVNGGIAVTAWTFTYGNTQTDYFIQPAGTLATGALTTAPNPSDGQRECFLSTQTQTALTWTANTGQTINGAPTAGVANTPICITYSLATLTWYRSP